jgi:multidrug resistance efflux pump
LFCLLLIVNLVAAAEAVAPKSPQAKRPKPAAGERRDAAAKKTRRAEKKPAADKPAAKQSEKADEAEPSDKPSETKPDDKPSSTSTADKTADQKPSTPATHKVARKPLKVDVNLEGTFEAATMAEIKLRPKSWKEFEVVSAIEHGTEVKKGDVLVTFDAEDIDKAIADRRRDQQVAKMALEAARHELTILKKATPLELKAAERTEEQAQEDLERFLEIDRPMSEKSAKFNYESSQKMLEYEQEELRQLEKMYEADDLTEDTEEIILKRQRDTVERAKFYVQLSKTQYEDALEVSLPRHEENVKERTERAELLRRRTDFALPSSLKRTEIELARQDVQYARSEVELARLVADRKLMTIKAPFDGLLYYGRCTRGQWSGGTSAADDLQPGGTISTGEVFMTVVQPRPVFVRATMEERHLHRLKPGMKGVVEPKGFPDLKLPAVIDRVDAVPNVASKFEVKVKLELGVEADGLMPGMAGTVKFVPYKKRDALVAPASAVFSDELDEEKRFVYLAVKDGPPRKQPVTVGEKSGDQIEILDGVDEGDEILAQRPEKK